MAYNGTIKVIAGLKQANNGDFPIVDSSAVRVDDNTNLDEKLASIDSALENVGGTITVATSVSDGNTNPVSSGAVFTKLSEYATKNDVSSVYKFKGSIGGNDNIGDPYIDTTTGYINFTSWVAYNGAFENGDVYNISEDFTTDSSFKEGAGKKYKAGTNIACIKTTTSTTWDVLGGSMQIDLSGYATNDSLADVATSGSYNDLTDKPNIPEGVIVDTAMSDTSTNSVQNKVIKAYVDANGGVITSVNSKTGAVVLNASDVGALPIIGGAATGKIIVTSSMAAGFESVRTISSGQERRAGFFVNSDGTSKFVNKNGSIDTASLIFDDTGVYYALGDSGSKATGKLMATQEYVDENIPEIPTKTSDLTNDSGFLTEHQSLTNYATNSSVDTKIANAITNALGGDY